MFDVLVYMTIILAVMEICFAILLLHVWKQNKKDREIFFTARKNTYAQLEKITVQAVKDSQKILEQATLKQASLTKNVETYADVFKQKYETMIDESISELQSSAIKSIQNSSAQFDQHLQNHLSTLASLGSETVQSIQNNTKAMLDAHTKKIEAVYQDSLEHINQELELYKVEQKQLLSQKIEAQTKPIIKDFLSTYSQSIDHHALVLQLIDSHIPTHEK